MGLESPSRQLDYYLKCIYIYIHTLQHYIYGFPIAIRDFALCTIWFMDI